MLACGMGERGDMISGIIDKRFVILCNKIILYNGIELNSPRVRLCMHIEQHEVMDEIPAAKDQDTLFS